MLLQVYSHTVSLTTQNQKMDMWNHRVSILFHNSYNWNEISILYSCLFVAMIASQQLSPVQSQKPIRSDDLASEPTEENSTTTKLSKDEKPVVDKKDLDPNVYMQNERARLLQVI